MPYAKLYGHCQGLSPRIPRNVIRNKVLELTGVAKVAHVRTTMDTRECRGFYLKAGNNEHRLVQQVGGAHLIVTARGLEAIDINEERFIFLKEIMHLFDGVAAATDTGDKFEVLLNEFSISKDRSPQSNAEVTCFYRALAALCPEKTRQEYLAKREGGQIDDYAIALEIGLPLVYVPRLFVSDYNEMVKWLCTN